MQIYDTDNGLQLRLNEVDFDSSDKVAFWLERLFPEDFKKLILGYYSLLLNNGNSPLEAALKTLEVMGPAYVQSEKPIADAIVSLRRELEEWFRVIGQKYDWF